MPPRLSPRGLLLAGVVLLAGALLVGLVPVLLTTAVPAASGAASPGLVASSVLAWVQQVALLVGAGLVAAAFAVRAAAPGDDVRASAPEQPAGRDWN